MLSVSEVIFLKQKLLAVNYWIAAIYVSRFSHFYQYLLISFNESRRNYFCFGRSQYFYIYFFFSFSLFFRYVLQDQMIDVYKKEGAFPTSSSSKHFEGPIRCHYRPRRLWSVLIIIFSSYFTLPPVFYALYTLLCSGIVNVLVALILVFGGKKKPWLLQWGYFLYFSFENISSDVWALQASRFDPSQFDRLGLWRIFSKQKLVVCLRVRECLCFSIGFRI